MLSIDELEKEWVLTMATPFDDQTLTYWFGRRDMSDELAPTKITASSAGEAWQRLAESLEAK